MRLKMCTTTQSFGCALRRTHMQQRYKLLLCHIPKITFLHWNDYSSFFKQTYKDIARPTAQISVSWPNPKQWQMIHTTTSIWLWRKDTHILTIIAIWTTAMGKTDLNEGDCFNRISRSLVIWWFQISSQINFVLGTKIMPLIIFLIADCTSLLIVINCILL